MTTTQERRYRPTESQFKGNATEMYVTYDIEQKTRGGGSAIYPKVKRVYVAGKVRDWRTGTLQKLSGREVHGVEIAYEQTRKAYRRQGYTVRRGGTTYQVPPSTITASSQKFRKVVEVPKNAKNIRFYSDRNKLPQKYRHALQNIR